MVEYIRRTWAEVDLDRLVENYHTIRAAMRPGTQMMAVVKADAYGHGAVAVARQLAVCGAERFAVSNLEEAVQLRRAGISAPILILGFTPPECAAQLAEFAVTQTVFSADFAAALSAQAVKAGVTVKIHIKADTGMSRIGFFVHTPQAMETAVEEISEVCRLPGLDAEGIFTHFASADESDNGREFTRLQYMRLTALIDALGTRGVTFAVRHCCNSAGIAEYREMNLEAVRPGIVLYGLHPSEDCVGLPLKPVMQLRSVISLIKEIPAGTPVSYGRTFCTDRPMRIATVPIGYADGYPRLASSKACALVAGKRAPVVGRVCMDQLMLDVTGIDGACEDAVVTLFGEDGGEILPVEELSRAAQTISYETVCLVGKRVPRVYLQGGREIGVLSGVLDGQTL